MTPTHRYLMRGLLPALLSAASFAGFAQAADLGPYGRRPAVGTAQPAYYPQAFGWTGFYAGLQGGYGWGGTTATSTALSNGSQQGFSYSTSGGVGGVHAGYNWQINSVVLGVETDLELSGIGGSGIGTTGGGHITNVDWLGSLRARAGIAAGSTLFYLTGGLAYGSVAVDRSFGAGLTAVAGDSSWRTGWTLGAGIEHAFSSNMSLRLEYRYTDLGPITYTIPASNLTDTSDATHSAVRAGLSFRF